MYVPVEVGGLGAGISPDEVALTIVRSASFATPDNASLVKQPAVGTLSREKMGVPVVTVPFIVTRTVGLVLSMLKPGLVSVLVFPALSAQDPLMVTFVPSLVIRLSEQEASPEVPSVPVNLTVTLVLFQPLAFAEGEALSKAIVGLVASRLMTTLFEAVPPLLVAEQVIVTPVVSAVTLVTGQAGEVMADSASATDQVTFTLLMYQPFLPSLPVMVGVITGGVVSPPFVTV